MTKNLSIDIRGLEPDKLDKPNKPNKPDIHDIHDTDEIQKLLEEGWCAKWQIEAVDDLRRGGRSTP